MQLCIDQGNSSAKIGIFNGDDLITTEVYTNFSVEDIADLYKKYDIDSCILSNVGSCKESVVTELEKRNKNFIRFNHETPIPIKNLYASPQTLGSDRLAGVIGASYLKPNTNSLVIDAGSAITYDFINAESCYYGGSISPGINLRLRALHEFTEKLPLVEAKTDSPLIGSNTNEAILSGVMYGIVFEMDGYIDDIKKQYADLSIFLTGGSIFYFENKLKNATFANKNLILIGLNRILQYNV